MMDNVRAWRKTKGFKKPNGEKVKYFCRLDKISRRWNRLCSSGRTPMKLRLEQIPRSRNTGADQLCG